MFTRFGGWTDARVKAQIRRGRLMRAMLSQPRYSPLRLADEVAIAFALREGLLDPMEEASFDGFRRALPDWLDAHAPDAVTTLARTGELAADQRATFRNALAALAARVIRAPL